MAPRASTVPPSITRYCPGAAGSSLNSLTSCPSRVVGRKESVLIQILPSSPIDRTCMRILSAWPMIITLKRSSRPGWVSSTTPAWPLNCCRCQPSGAKPSKWGLRTP